jgi:putative transposase
MYHLSNSENLQVCVFIYFNLKFARVKAWQSRSLDASDPIVCMDCIHLKVRDNGTILNTVLQDAIGVNLDGINEVPGQWMMQAEVPKFWLQMVT